MASFSGHETFPLRFTWLAKAVEAVLADPEAFRDEAAIATFGVGRNMVRSIRHWALATGVLEPAASGLAPTDLGAAVFAPDGTDPYCEDPGTHWLLHWRLCRDADRATLWHVVFGHGRGGPLDLGAAREALDPWLAAHGEAPPSEATLKRDLLCLVNTYAPRRSAALEDAVGSPLAGLGLAPGVGLREGRRPSLSPAVFAHAALDFWERAHPEAETLAVSRLLHAPASPGRVFRLSESAAHDLVTRAEALPEPPFRYASTAGVEQLYRAPGATASAALAQHYAVAA